MDLENEKKSLINFFNIQKCRKILPKICLSQGLAKNLLIRSNGGNE